MLIRIDCAPGFAPPSSASPEGGQPRRSSWLEWGVVEFQGELVGMDMLPGAEEQDVGEIIDIKGDSVTIAIGQHLLEGSIMDLAKPFLVVEVPRRDDDPPATTTTTSSTNSSESGDDSRELTVQGIVKKRLLFKTRPKPRGNV